jgi:hypothetical protein
VRGSATGEPIAAVRYRRALKMPSSSDRAGIWQRENGAGHPGLLRAGEQEYASSIDIWPPGSLPAAISDLCLPRVDSAHALEQP